MVVMPIITCPNCNRRYDPGDQLDDVPEGVVSKVACPACAQWVRLPDGEPIPPPRLPRQVAEQMRSQSRLVDEPVILECPDCSMKLKLKSPVKAGQRVRCPKCTFVFSPKSPEAPKPPPSATTATRPGSNRPLRRRPDPDEEDEEEQLEEEHVEEEEEEEEEKRPRRRKRRRRKSGNSLGMWLGIGGGVLGVGLLVALFFILGPFGGAYAKHEKEAKELIRLFTELSEALESVKDRATAQTAAQKINKICDQLEQLGQRIKNLPLISKADDKRLQDKYEPEIRKLNQRMISASTQAGMKSQGEPSFVQAGLRLIQVGQQLQSVTQQRAR